MEEPITISKEESELICLEKVFLIDQVLKNYQTEFPSVTEADLIHLRNRLHKRSIEEIRSLLSEPRCY